VSLRRLIALAMIAGMPGIARAQFTTFIPPKVTVADSVKAVVAAEQKAQADSTAHAQLTSMRTWVDSAAGLTPTTTAADSMAQSTAASTTSDTMTMRNGSRAPATASLLPLLTLTGFVALLAGAFLLRGARPARTGA
jgi:cytochrome b